MRIITIGLILLNFVEISLSQTDSQVQSAIQIIKKKGLTDKQVRDLGKSRGVPGDLIEKVLDNKGNTPKTLQSPSQKDISGMNFENQTQDNIEQVKNNLDENVSSDELNIDTEVDKILTGRRVGGKMLKNFGYDIFKRDPSLFQPSTIGVVDPSYLIGPGDEIIVMLWGETQFRQVLKVDKEGFIFIPEVGQVFVNGLNLKLLEAKLFRVLSQSYASLDNSSRRATTFLDVSLGNLRSLRIQVLGEVAQPGAYTVSHNTTLFSSLYFFNGPTTLGTLREIQLIRDNKIIATIDFYDYLLTGKTPNDIQLQLDDVIFIPKRGKTVSIFGEIKRNAIYELKEDESMKELLQFSGGLSVSAYTELASINRIVPYNLRQEVGFERMHIDFSLDSVVTNENVVKLYDGDEIFISSILETKNNYVTIQGSVLRPGLYQRNEPMTLVDLIKKADSLLGDTYLERIDIIRTNDDYTETLLKYNLGKALSGDTDHNVELENLDSVIVYRRTEMIPDKFVSINGHVKFPGKYLLRENLKIHDVIFKYGGLFDEDFKNKTFLDRADLIRYDNNYINKYIIPFNLGNVIDDTLHQDNFKLIPGDKIFVYSKDVFNALKTVTITGPVRKQGKYEYKTNMKLQDLIIEAGGVKENILKYVAEIARIDPKKVGENIYAETIRLELDNTQEFYLNSSNNKKKIKLSPYDIVSIIADPYYKPQRTITVNGAVKYPGQYAILGPDETIGGIIERAGGVTKDAYLFSSLFLRDEKEISVDLNKAISKPGSNKDFKVQDGDIVIINTAPDYVIINGEVNSVGVLPFENGLRVRDLIKKAGGLTPDADKNQIFVKYPNGNSKKYSGFLKNPKVYDGSKVFVGKKKEVEPFDSTEFFKEIAIILANVAQVFAILSLAN